MTAHALSPLCLRRPLSAARTLLALGCLSGLLAPAWASENTLERVLQQRFEGDRTGACVVAARVQGEQVIQARYCATGVTGTTGATGATGDAGSSRPPVDPQAAFEIGSISKPLLGLLVAQLIEQGRWRLDDPIERHLPAGSSVPRQGERQITVRDLLTHSSGLPPLPALMVPARQDDPYATLTEKQLLDSLAQARLNGAIGAQSSYSNFGAMVLSLAVNRAFEGDLERALRERVFAPLKMTQSWIAEPPPGAPAAARGHTSSGQPAAPWTILPALGGVGMVKSTLADMVRLAQALLRPEATPLQAAITAGFQPLAHQFGMFWMLGRAGREPAPGHEGGTGGFSSLILVLPQRQEAVVILSDTALADLGGLGDVAFAALGLRPAPNPRRAAPWVPAQREALVGEYELPGALLSLSSEAGRLMARVPGQQAFELLVDDRGDLYTPATSLLITPQREGAAADAPVQRLLWRQGGGVFEVPRKGAAASATAQNPAWRAWAGEYELAPGFVLRIFERDGRLFGQATGQGAFPLEVVAGDQVENKTFGVMIAFVRDAAGKVSSLVFRQGGQTIPAKRR
jgi:serine-type D-Ala-D-Ala carboxypeptidase/endopeptidase